MKNLVRTLSLIISLAVLFSLAAPVFAYGPILSVSNNGSNTNITVSGASPYSSVQLSYTSPGSSLPTTISNFGTTDGSGYFVTGVSSSSYGISNGVSIYVTVGGQQSNIVNVGSTGSCTYNCGNPYNLSLSQVSVNINVGQTVSVTAYNYSGGNLYVSSNSNSAAVSATVSGNQINFYGLAYGNSTVSICSNYSGGNCASVYVTVGNVLGATTYAVSIRDNYFSPNSITIPVGGSVTWTNLGNMAHTVTADNGFFDSGNLNLSNTFSRVFNTAGTYYYYCIFHGAAGNVGMAGVIYVTGSSGSGNPTFSQSNVNLNLNQSSSVNIYGGYSGSSYYISSNTNLSVVSASISGNLLNLYAGNIGSSTINVCQSGSSYCASVYVTVGGGISGSGVSLSQTTLNLNVGQSSSVNIYGGGGYGYYVSSNSNPIVAITSQNGSVLNVYGGQVGSSSLQICQNNASSCASLYVIVGGGYSGGSSVLGASIYPNGQLINDGGTVYIIYKNTKTGFVSASVFRALGFTFSSVISGSTSRLSKSGYIIRTAAAAHPWGSWIKNGGTVYFVHESGLIPVSDWSTFLNNGGSDSLIVPANIYDFQLPMLSVMTANDARLR